MGNCGHNGATGWMHFEPYPHHSLDLCSRCYVIVTKKHDDTLRDMEARIAALEAQLAQYRWRRVEEALPEGRRALLIRIPGDPGSLVRIAYYHTDDVWFSDGYPVNPTHWMPLPLAPEEGE